MQIVPLTNAYAGGVRPSFAPFAIAATAILAVNNLLVTLKLWPTVRLVIPLAALALLAVAIVLWWRGA